MKAAKMITGILALLFTVSCVQPEPAFMVPENPLPRSMQSPEKDFFTGSELLDLNGLTKDDVSAVVIHVWFEDGSEGDLLLTDRAAVRDVFQTFANAEIAFDILFSTNPGTGEQLDMDWYLADGTVLRFIMRHYLGIEGINDPLLFSSGHSQDDYIELYLKYQSN